MLNRLFADHVVIFNEKSAYYKKAKKKWNHKLTGSVPIPVQELTEDWLK